MVKKSESLSKFDRKMAARLFEFSKKVFFEDERQNPVEFDVFKAHDLSLS
jgi:hypothetical protein